MNHLKNWQIPFRVITASGFEGSFKFSVISHRLHAFICHKINQGNWDVFYLHIDPENEIFGYQIVLVSPTHGTVLAVKKDILTGAKK